MKTNNPKPNDHILNTEKRENKRRKKKRDKHLAFHTHTFIHRRAGVCAQISGFWDFGHHGRRVYIALLHQ